MLKQIAWNTFKNTGNINTMMELLEVNNLEKNQIKNTEENINTNYNKEINNKKINN